jgi:ferric-dicitrate binding protein FerR (iron transport regulator)
MRNLRLWVLLVAVGLLVGCASAASVDYWVFRRLYRGAPLSKVIKDVQLYTPRLIELDPALAHVRFSGILYRLDSQQAEQWVRGLRIIFPVRIEESRLYMTVRCVEPGCPGLHR